MLSELYQTEGNNNHISHQPQPLSSLQPPFFSSGLRSYSDQANLGAWPKSSRHRGNDWERWWGRQDHQSCYHLIHVLASKHAKSAKSHFWKLVTSPFLVSLGLIFLQSAGSWLLLMRLMHASHGLARQQRQSICFLGEDAELLQKGI